MESFFCSPTLSSLSLPLSESELLCPQASLAFAVALVVAAAAAGAAAVA